MADKIAVMNAGRIERFGLKDEVFSDPRTKSAARLTGYKNLSRGERLGKTRFYAADWGAELTVLYPKFTSASFANSKSLFCSSEISTSSSEKSP